MDKTVEVTGFLDFRLFQFNDTKVRKSEENWEKEKRKKRRDKKSRERDR